jgi:hypothetical protein
MNDEDSKTILKALGGTRGLLDSGLPALVFLIVFTSTHKLNDAIYGALIISAVLALIRIVRKDTLQHALSGLLGVAVCAIFSRSTGKAQDFYLPGLIINVVYGTLYAVANCRVATAWARPWADYWRGYAMANQSAKKSRVHACRLDLGGAVRLPARRPISAL